MRVHARKLLTHSFLYGASNVASVVPGVVLVPLYTRYLAPETFGAFALLTTYASLLINFLDFGLSTALVRRYFEYGDDDAAARRRMVSTAFWLMLGSSIVVTAVIYAQSEAVTRLTLDAYPGVNLVRLMTATVLATTLSAVPLSVLRVTQRPGAYFQLSAVRGIGTLIIVPILLTGFGMGAEGVFLGQLAVALLVAGAGCLLTYRDFGFTFSAAESRALLGVGLVFWPTMLLHWLIDFSDISFLRRFHGLEVVAIYAVGYKLGQIVFYVVLAFAIGWSPILFGILRDPQPQLILARMFRFYVLALATLCYTLALFSDQIVALLGPSTYAQAAPVAIVLCVAYVMYGLFVFFLSGVIVAGKFQFQTLALFGGALLNLALNFALIPWFGMWGAAASTLAAFAVTAGLGYRFAQRLYPVPYRLCDMGPIGGALVLGYLSYVIAVDAGLNAAVARAAAALLYALLIVGTGGISLRELRRITTLWAVAKPAA